MCIQHVQQYLIHMPPANPRTRVQHQDGGQAVVQGGSHGGLLPQRAAQEALAVRGRWGCGEMGRWVGSAWACYKRQEDCML